MKRVDPEALERFLCVGDLVEHSRCLAYGPGVEPAIPTLRRLAGDLPECGAAIGSIGPAALPTLRWMVTDKNPIIRRGGVMGLEVLGPLAQEALPMLHRALADGDDAVCQAAIPALASVGPKAPKTAPALAGLLTGRTPEIAAAAAKAIIQLGPLARSALPNLRKQLADPDLRLTVARIIAYVTPEDASDAVSILAEFAVSEHGWTDSEVRTCLIFLGPRAAGAVPVLTAALKAPNLNQHVGEHCLELLLAVQPENPAAVKDFQRRLELPDPRDQLVAAEWLVRAGTPGDPARSALERLLIYPQRQTRIQAAGLLLRRAPHTQALAALRDMLQGQDNFSRRQAALQLAMGGLGDRGVLLELERALWSESYDDQELCAVLNALAGLGPRATPLEASIREHLYDLKAPVRSAACLALKRLADTPDTPDTANKP
ncbi:MAG: HEAT repeat domain-containing protein [Planctomycetota bacterium]|nr:HEAT repeat domain-containing protein [Planctomycetota bacterium]